ncbi:MAG TPA: hypothetical protein VFY32_08930, partial [Solirubrobacteraceae bacterium]|nr:hypothetical protein [Solirubrobacteraceae bacterium]
EHGGYRQVTVDCVKETVIKTFSDWSAGKSSDPIDLAYGQLEESSRIYYRFLDEEDSVCECGLAKQINEQQRPVYESLTASLLTRQKAAKESESTEELVTEISERLEAAEVANRAAAEAGPAPAKPKAPKAAA